MTRFSVPLMPYELFDAERQGDGSWMAGSGGVFDLRGYDLRPDGAYVWPARHFASSSTDPELPPMGQRFRLRADADLSGFSDEALVIARALQTYGMILADNGSPWYLSGAPDDRWDDDALRDLRQLQGSDFEAVDASGVVASPNSGQVAPRER